MTEFLTTDDIMTGSNAKKSTRTYSKQAQRIIEMSNKFRANQARLRKEEIKAKKYENNKFGLESIISKPYSDLQENRHLFTSVLYTPDDELKVWPKKSPDDLSKKLIEDIQNHKKIH